MDGVLCFGWCLWLLMVSFCCDVSLLVDGVFAADVVVD